jgi:hypothetical protein
MGIAGNLAYAVFMESTISPGMFIIGGAIVVSIFSIAVYAALAVYFPEWVGITGKVARAAEESHLEGTTTARHAFEELSE